MRASVWVRARMRAGGPWNSTPCALGPCTVAGGTPAGLAQSWWRGRVSPSSSRTPWALGSEVTHLHASFRLCPSPPLSYPSVPGSQVSPQGKLWKFPGWLEMEARPPQRLNKLGSPPAQGRGAGAHQGTGSRNQGPKRPETGSLLNESACSVGVILRSPRGMAYLLSLPLSDPGRAQSWI